MTTFLDVLRDTAAEPRDAATTLSDTDQLVRPDWTDLGNARRLAARHGRDLRYCHELGGWFVWDEQRWALDRTGKVERLAKETALATRRAGLRIKNDDSDTRKKFLLFATRSQSEARLRAMTNLARSETEVAIAAEQLDAHPWLLNVANGALDLRTGKLRPHRRGDLLTKLAPVEYYADAHSDVLERFLDQLSGSDRELRDYLQRAVGYSLTGTTSEEAMFLLLGPGGSGKSTFIEAIKATLGDYVKTADFETFLKRSASGAPRNDIARLNGARMVIACEVDEGKALAEGVVKALTGGDTVTARKLYHEAFEFKPEFKLWLVANHAPVVSATDSGMWRRIQRIPCNNALRAEDQNPSIKAALQNVRVAGPAILKWALDGCLAWQREGLRPPRAIVEATKAYQAEMDPLTQFIAERCELGEDKVWSSEELSEEYREFAQEFGARSLSAKQMAQALRARGCRPSKITSGARKGWACWTGIGKKGAR